MALETTRVSASPRLAASWPTCTRAPSASSSFSVAESAESLPETGTPRASMTRAIPDIPAPPIPAKWTRPRSLSGTTSAGCTSAIA